MSSIKITSWNVEHLDELLNANLSINDQKRKNGIIQEMQAIDADIFCILEGPKGAAAIDQLTSDFFGNDYIAIKSPDGKYDTLGTQWIWFIVKKELANKCTLLETHTYDTFAGGRVWPVHYWGSFTKENHQHYRHPQVLILDVFGQRVEFIGLHLKSKFVNGGSTDWKAGGTRKEDFIKGAIKARIKLTTEASNVRRYIEKKFEQVENPAIFVLGDLNDGPGKEHFESLYLHFDLLNNIQGDIFRASQFLNHALFDFSDQLRWSYAVDDFVTGSKEKILIDHIMFTQALVNWTLPNVCVEPKAGKVEHEIHDLVNATLNRNQKTSDHKPVSVVLSIREMV